MSIGVFDSGIGGLNVLSKLMSHYEGGDYYYYADNSNMPYSNKTFSEILLGVEKAIKYFEAMSVDSIVIACNTAGITTRGWITSSVPIISMQPNVTKARILGRPLLLATPPTKKALDRYNLLSECVSIDTCTLSRQIEDCAPTLDKIGQRLIENIDKIRGYDSIILGCSHYIYLESILYQKYEIPIYNGIDEVLQQVIFKRKFMPRNNTTKINFYFTGEDMTAKYMYILDNIKQY